MYTQCKILKKILSSYNAILGQIYSQLQAKNCGNCFTNSSFKPPGGKCVALEYLLNLLMSTHAFLRWKPPDYHSRPNKLRFSHLPLSYQTVVVGEIKVNENCKIGRVILILLVLCHLYRKWRQWLERVYDDITQSEHIEV